MRTDLGLFRLTAHVALAATVLNVSVPAVAWAQPAPPPVPQPYRPQPSEADPPSRVGRIAHLAGTVSLRAEGDEQWSPASVNFPVSSGEAFWTEPSASAELEIADSRIALAATTAFDIATLDSTGLQAVAAQGEAYLNLRDLPATEAWSVQTPRGLVHFNTPGRYYISVGSTEQPTRVTVLDGSAQIDGPNLALRVTSGQTATINGNISFEGSVGPEVKDAFLIARLDAERPPPAPPVPLPPQVAVMPGGNDLNGYGNWSEAPDYGRVWYPPVSPAWVPYREGHWAYVAPWGWTWIDDAPWGFAPFHYGRWIEIGGRWAWTPGVRTEFVAPVYAPALVTFIGLGAGIALGAAIASRSIGWVPLGPREPFHPWYHASDRYMRDVNINHVTTINNNVTTINNVTGNTYVNQHAATVMPGAEMARSRPVQAVAQPLTARQFAAARPIIGELPIHPTTETAGITPAVARSFNLPVAALPRSAPGPGFRAQAAIPDANGFARPPNAASGPGSPEVRPTGGGPPLQPGRVSVPALAAPGARPAAVPALQPGQPQVPPAVFRRGEPPILTPGGVAPAAAPPAQAVLPAPAHHADPRSSPQVVASPHAEPQHAAPPPAAMPHVVTPVQTPHGGETPRPTPQPMAGVAASAPLPHAEAPRAAPQPMPAPRMAAPAQVPHFEPPRIAPHQEPPRLTAPAPHPEPPRPAAPAPVAHEKRPGER